MPIIREKLVREAGNRWIGKKDVEIDIMNDESRELIYEGKLKYIL